jgi:hypothetical protein
MEKLPGQWLANFLEDECLDHEPLPGRDWFQPAAKFPLVQVAIADIVALQSLYCVEPPMARMRTL